MSQPAVTTVWCTYSLVQQCGASLFIGPVTAQEALVWETKPLGRLRQGWLLCLALHWLSALSRSWRGVWRKRRAQPGRGGHGGSRDQGDERPLGEPPATRDAGGRATRGLEGRPAQGQQSSESPMGAPRSSQRRCVPDRRNSQPFYVGFVSWGDSRAPHFPRWV